MAPGEKDDRDQQDHQKKGPGFTVSDRRSFAEAAAPSPTVPTTPAAPPDLPPDHDPEAGGGKRTLPPLDFHTFILSLGSSALLHLGELDDPESDGGGEPDLPLAKHTIDVIAMLQEKTKGNLSAPEERLIESLLFDLRLKYVEHSKSQRPG